MRSTTKKGPRTLGLRRAREAARRAPFAEQIKNIEAQVQAFISAARAARAGTNALARPGTPPAEPEPVTSPKAPAPLPAPAGAEPNANSNPTLRPGYSFIGKVEPSWFKLTGEARVQVPPEGEERAITLTNLENGTAEIEVGETRLCLNRVEFERVRLMLWESQTPKGSS